MNNPYAHLRVCDARALVDDYRQQAHELLVALYEAAALLQQTGLGDLIAAGRMYAGAASVIEDAIYMAEEEDQAELADREGWKEDTR
jgi:hypothetical protein